MDFLHIDFLLLLDSNDHIINLMYISNKCYSPIPSLTSHLEHDCLPPCIDTEKIYETINKRSKHGT